MDTQKSEIQAAMIFNPEQGALYFKDVRYLFIRPETIASLQKSLEAEIGPVRAGEILFAGGFTGGQLSGKKYKQLYGLNDHDAITFMCRMGKEIGWGYFQLISLNSQDKHLIVQVKHSPFAEAYQTITHVKQSQTNLEPSHNTGVCHLIRGVLGGLGAGIFNQTIQATETHCLALGDPHCQFEIKGLMMPK